MNKETKQKIFIVILFITMMLIDPICSWIGI